MNDARQAFGSALRSHREQQGIPLSAIADTTKIGTALLAGLERGDLSRWPKGIFRRAFFRDYVIAIGLSPEGLTADFARVFPDDTVAAPTDRGAALRLTLAPDDRPNVSALKRVATVFGELVTVVAIGMLAGWLLDVNLWSAVGAMALAYYPISNLCVERRLLRTARPLRSRLRASLWSDRQVVSTGEVAANLAAGTTHIEPGTSKLEPNLNAN